MKTPAPTGKVYGAGAVSSGFMLTAHLDGNTIPQTGVSGNAKGGQPRVGVFPSSRRLRSGELTRPGRNPAPSRACQMRDNYTPTGFVRGLPRGCVFKAGSIERSAGAAAGHR